MIRYAFVLLLASCGTTVSFPQSQSTRTVVAKGRTTITPQPRGPGATCEVDADCQTTEFCASPAGVCGGMAGTCAKFPISSPSKETYSPACGCNGVTYFNEGEASAEGINLLYRGECRVEHMSGLKDKTADSLSRLRRDARARAFGLTLVCFDNADCTSAETCQLSKPKPEVVNGVCVGAETSNGFLR